jgi:integrase
VVDLAPGLIDALREHKNRQFDFSLEHGLVPTHDLVFTVVGRHGIEGMGHKQVARIWQDVRRKAGIPRVRIHDLRHFAATTMLDAGVPLPNVSEILGHGQTSTTANIYANAVRSIGAAAVAEIEKALLGGQERKQIAARADAGYQSQWSEQRIPSPLFQAPDKPAQQSASREEAS